MRGQQDFDSGHRRDCAVAWTLLHLMKVAATYSGDDDGDVS